VDAKYITPDHIKAVDELSFVFNRELEKELNVICIGDGGMPHDVEVIHVSFVTYKLTLRAAIGKNAFTKTAILYRECVR
jgi:hypothetical protein